MALRALCDCPLRDCHPFTLNGECRMEFRHLVPLKYMDATGKAKIWWLCEHCYNEAIRRAVGGPAQ